MNFELIKNAIAEELSALGITEYEIYYMSNLETSVGTLNKEINAFTSGIRAGICLRVVYDGKLGYASTELMDVEEMKELALRALENAKHTEKPDKVGIFKGSDAYEDSRIPEYRPLSADELKTAAKSVGENIFTYSDKVRDGSSSQTVSAGFDIRIVNSHGLNLSTSCGVNVGISEAVVAEGEEFQSAFALEELKPSDIDGSVKVLVSKAVDEAISKIGAGLVPSGKYNIVFDGKQMRSLLSVFSSVFSARMVLDGISMLKGKVGEEIAAPIVTITDDPQREGSSIGTTFDAEGVATKRRAVVDGGVLKTYLHNRETALEMGVESTANASKGDYSSPVSIMPHSFAIEPGDKSFEELLALAGDGILITELKGLHAGANPITGDFSLESAGFMIKGGKVCEAVKSFTVAGNFLSLLKSISAIGDKLELGVATSFTGFGSPAVLVPDMSVAGK